MSDDRGRQLDRLLEQGARNSARLDALEAEMTRARTSLHTLRGQVAGVLAIGQQVGHLAEQLEDLTGELRTLSRRAIERPTPASWSAAAGWTSVLVALAALLVATFR